MRGKNALRLALLRHGLTEGNLQRRFDGVTDRPLCPEGQEALAKIGVFPAVERVYVSPLLRARQTASALFPKAEQRVLPGLGEMDFGHFEGKNHRELEGDPLYQAWLNAPDGPCPGGESLQALSDRVCAALLEAVASERMAWEEGGKMPYPIPIVSHGGVLMSLLNRFTSQGEASGMHSWQIPNGGGYLVTLPEDFGPESYFDDFRAIEDMGALFCL